MLVHDSMLLTQTHKIPFGEAKSTYSFRRLGWKLAQQGWQNKGGWRTQASPRRPPETSSGTSWTWCDPGGRHGPPRFHRMCEVAVHWQVTGACPQWRMRSSELSWNTSSSSFLWQLVHKLRRWRNRMWRSWVGTVTHGLRLFLRHNIRDGTLEGNGKVSSQAKGLVDSMLRYKKIVNTQNSSIASRLTSL